MIARFVGLSFLLVGPAMAADVPSTSHSEIATLFKADQADRTAAFIDWKVVSAADTARRVRTKQLLDQGKLNSGEDFYDAAFIFQHGDTAADYMRAHLLAMVAVARGQPQASWIAAATLDRYLQEIGKPQVLGTQFTGSQNGKFTQEPYDRTLASDAMRKALQVPSLFEQEDRRHQYETEASQRMK